MESAAPFPPGFLFGASVSAHQVEGGNTNNSDWWWWRRQEDAGAATEAERLLAGRGRAGRSISEWLSQLVPVYPTLCPAGIGSAA